MPSGQQASARSGTLSSSGTAAGSTTSVSRQDARLAARQESEIRAARILFIAGCFALPWLWGVSLLYHRKRFFDKDAPPELRSCESILNAQGRGEGCFLAFAPCVVFNLTFSSHFTRHPVSFST